MAETTNYIKHTNKNPLTNFATKNYYKVLIREAKKLRPASVLDVGAGEGFILSELKKNKIGKELEGIEYMDDAIELGKKMHPTISIKKGDIYQLPYKDNSFDLVLCTEVLEHLERPDLAMRELLRVTKKFLLLSVPNEPIFTIQRILRGKNVLGLGAHPEHIQHWSSKRFVKFVSQFLAIKTVCKPIPWTMVIGKKS